MAKLTLEKLKKLFHEDEEDWFAKWKGDNFTQGLQILLKYFDPTKVDLVVGAEHDIIYSIEIDILLKSKITEEDIEALANLNWMIEEDEFLACFV